MSLEAVHEFVRKANQEAGLRTELERALSMQEGAVAAFLAIAATHGCQFTASEFFAVAQPPVAAGDLAELNEADLEKVAGGGALTRFQFSGLSAGLLSRAAHRIGSLRAGPGALLLGKGLIGGAELEEELEPPSPH